MALLYLLFGFWLYGNQGALVYFPKDTPLAQCTLPEGVTFWQAGDERGILADFDNPDLLVFFHGNADSACDWRYLGVNHLNPLGFDVLVPEFPGYAGDARAPAKPAMEAMIAQVQTWARAQGYAHVSVMGYSLGTGAAALFARPAQVRQVILFAPFDSIYNVARAQGLMYPRWVLREDYDNVAALRGIDARVDILHGGVDQVIPVAHSLRLTLDLMGSGVQVVRRVVPGQGHHNLFELPAFDAYLADILIR